MWLTLSFNHPPSASILLLRTSSVYSHSHVLSLALLDTHSCMNPTSLLRSPCRLALSFGAVSRNLAPDILLIVMSRSQQLRTYPLLPLSYFALLAPDYSHYSSPSAVSDQGIISPRPAVPVIEGISASYRIIDTVDLSSLLVMSLRLPSRLCAISLHLIRNK